MRQSVPGVSHGLRVDAALEKAKPLAADRSAAVVHLLRRHVVEYWGDEIALTIPVEFVSSGHLAATDVP